MSAGGRPTLADVAARAGVDRSVASRVLNEDPKLSVRPATRHRVLRAARELDYTPNALARGLRTARSAAYGLLIPDFANPVYAALVSGAEAAAAERDCVLVTGSVAGDRSRTERHLALLRDGRIDGLLLAGVDADDALAARLARLESRWLLVNRRAAGARRFVVLDDEGAARLAVEHLIGLGHQRIAHLSGPARVDSSQRREAGYRRALAAHGLEPGPVLRAGYTSEAGEAAMAALLARRPRPTAVFVANVASAIGALAAARDAAVGVPGAVSVVAIHDFPLAGHLSPPLTTVRMPLEQLGRRAIERLATAGPADPVEEVVAGPMELVVRASTASRFADSPGPE